MQYLNTAPAEEPLTLDEAKSHLRVDFDSDDTYITQLIIGTRRYVENITNRSLITQTWEYYPEQWPSGNQISIPLPPLQSVTSVKYTDTDDAELTFDAAGYTVDIKSEPGRIVLNDGYSWPTVTLNATNPIQIIFACGYGDTSTVIPADIKAAMKLIISNYYENREPVIVGYSSVQTLPMAIDALLANYRIWPE